MKVFKIILILVLLFSLSGCADTDKGMILMPGDAFSVGFSVPISATETETTTASFEHSPELITIRDASTHDTLEIKDKPTVEEPHNTWPVIRLEAYEGGWLRPPCFLETINTDVSEMIVDNRLKLIINGEIYWIRLQKDKEMPTPKEHDKEYLERMNDPLKVGIRCLECGEEMIYEKYSIILMTNPPQIYIYCPECEYYTTIYN